MPDKTTIKYFFETHGAEGVAVAIEKNTKKLQRNTTVTQGSIGVAREYTKASNHISIAKQQENRLIELMTKNKQRERDAYIMATHAVSANGVELQKLSMWQKISIGQWKSAYPALTKLNNALNTVRWSMVNVAFGVAAIVAITSPFWLLTKQGMEYEEQLRKIASVSGQVYQSQAGLQALTGAVAGVAIGRPATFKEAADAMLEFQRAGFSLTDAMRDVPHIIDLSVAGFVDLKNATTIVTSVLHQFSNQGLTAQHAVDVIAKAAVSSATTVEDFGNALSYAGAMAAASGFTFEETAAALALLSNAGMRGSRAGTTLRQVMSKVSTMSKQGEESMNRLGLSFFNAEGSMKSLQEIFTQLNLVMTEMTQEDKARFIGDMFEIRSRSGVMALLNIIEQSSSAIDDFADVLKDSGFASRTAAEIQQASALRMKTAWGNFMVGLQPLATGMNNLFSSVIEKVEDFSNRFLVAMRRGGITQAFGELPITIQLLSLIAVVKTLTYAFDRLGISAAASTGMKAFNMSMAGQAGAAARWGTGVSVAKGVGTGATAGASAIGFTALAKAKGLATAAAVGLTSAMKGLLAFLGPVGVALAVLGGVYLVVSKHIREMSRQTSEQIQILMTYSTTIDALQAKEDFYRDRGMHGEAARTRQLRETLAQREEEYDKSSKRINRKIAQEQQKVDMQRAGKTGNILLDMGIGAQRHAMGTQERDFIPDTTTLDKYKAEEQAMWVQHLTSQEDAIRNDEERTELIQRAMYIVGGYTKNMIENADEFAKFSDSALSNAIANTEQYKELERISKEIADIEKDKDLSPEEKKRRTDVLEDRKHRNMYILLEAAGLITDEYMKTATASNQALLIDRQREDSLRVQSKTLEDMVEKYNRMQTPKSDGLLKDLGDEKQIFGIGGTLDEMRKHIPEARNEIDDLINSFWDGIAELEKWERELHAVNKAIDQFNKLIAIEEAALVGLNDQLKIHNDMISQLTSQRFVGETALDSLIFDVSQDIKKASLEAMGISDVYKFIQNAVNGVEGAFDGVLASVNAVTNATKTSEDAFKAWQDTVHEYIRGMIVQGNQLSMNTSDAVRQHATLLQSVTKIGQEDKKQKTEEEIMLDALSAARDYYYGGMHEQVSLAVQAQEDLAAVHNQTADTVIAALQREWTARVPIMEQIKVHEDTINDLKTAHEIGGKTLDWYRNEQARLNNEIDNAVDAIHDLITGHNDEALSVFNLTQKYKELAKAMDDARRPTTGNVNHSGGISVNSDGSLNPGGTPNFTPVTSSPDTGFVKETNFIDEYKKLLGMNVDGPFGDFIMRPNSSPVAFSPDDTVIGVKENNLSSPLGGSSVNIQNINITGSVIDNPKKMAKELVKEIKIAMRSS